MSSYDEIMDKYYTMVASELPPLEQTHGVLKSKIAEQQTIIEADLAKSKVQAWKRRDTVIPTRDNTAVQSAKEQILALHTDLAKLETRIADTKRRIAENELNFKEDAEVAVFTENLARPVHERIVLPIPAKIRKMEAREEAERFAKPGWVRLKLVKSPADLAKNAQTLRAATAKKMPRVVAKVEPEDDALSVLEDDDEAEAYAEYLAQLNEEN